ncbi:hypothetical protein DET54_12121 [Paenibacillus pabuli]|uniref:Fibronectin type-III domain-containing protein n=1 Tax=Paenibacillus pabuli TaxID=1472 RepID=A0ABX9BC94_9BACL|nr:fibronectin type III domain-containing protein [Paenibacillus pabuli]RAI85666.1 hypothetical protein DET54_12121 [Paenibacillus pabuli]
MKIYSKKVSFILSVLVLFLVINVLPVSAAVNYSGGYLDGKESSLYFGSEKKSGPYSQVTDNDETTFVTVNRSTVSTGNTVHFRDFGNLSITGLRLKSDLTNFTLLLRDMNGEITTINGTSLLKNGELNALNYENITRISIVNNSSVDGKVYEFNIYGEIELVNLQADSGDGQAYLSWNQVQNAESYIVSYGTEPGKYTESVTATKDEYGNFVVPGLTNGTTYYFVVNSVVSGVKSEYSNEASATPQGSIVEPEEPSGNHAILVVTMTTGLEKEYDLSMQEVNSFIDWYEAKQAGSGKASYAIDKHDNNKGPFKSRKDYILFDRVLTFEVSEY